MSGKGYDISGQSHETTEVKGDESRGPIRGHADDRTLQFRFHAGYVLADRFVIIRFLGSGGMGEVYEAEDRLLRGVQASGVHVALKTLSSRGAAVPGALDRFKKEVLLAREISHPNICPIYDAGHYEDLGGPSFFLTMKLLSGETLRRRLTKGPLPLEEAVAVTGQIASALHALHRAGIVHRDFKPSNIMVEGSGPTLRAIVTDFGLARKADLERTGSNESQFYGTPGYLAPEILNGEASTPACDLYSLGVVVHEIFCARKPRTKPGIDSAKVHPDFLASAAPPFCVDLVQECLSGDPAQRYRAFASCLPKLDPAGDRHQAIYETEQPVKRQLLTRRRMIGSSAMAGMALAAAVYYEHDEIADLLLNPLPAKRFVAILQWPAVMDRRLGPAVSGVIDAIESELSRVEAFDKNLLVLASTKQLTGPPSPAELAGIRDNLGANLILATSGRSQRNRYEISLKLLDSSSNRTLRQREVTSSEINFAELASKAVSAAASLLQVNRYLSTGDRLHASTQSPAALNAMQQADALIKQPNDTGLKEAIEKYKEALELDPRFGLAQARLATAYCRLNGMTGESAALDLAELNAKAALTNDVRLVDGHLALSWVYQNRGMGNEALSEISKALALDPSNPVTLVWRGDLFKHLNRLPEAVLTYGRVTRERPNYWLAHQQLGWALDAMCRYQEALQSFRRANMVAPRNLLPITNIGAIQLKLGQYEEAQKNLEESLKMQPTALATLNLAQLFRATGRVAEAVRMAEKTVELEPHGDTGWLELGDCHSVGPDHSAIGRDAARQAYHQAQKEAEMALQVDQTDGPTAMNLALYRLKTGTPDSTLDSVAKAETAGAVDPDSQLTKVRILDLIGKRDDAIRTLRSLLQKGVTTFQVDFVAELQSLRRDPRYTAVSQQKQG